MTRLSPWFRVLLLAGADRSDLCRFSVVSWSLPSPAPVSTSVRPSQTLLLSVSSPPVLPRLGPSPKSNKNKITCQEHNADHSLPLRRQLSHQVHLGSSRRPCRCSLGNRRFRRLPVPPRRRQGQDAPRRPQRRQRCRRSRRHPAQGTSPPCALFARRMSPCLPRGFEQLSCTMCPNKSLLASEMATTSLVTVMRPANRISLFRRTCTRSSTSGARTATLKLMEDVSTVVYFNPYLGRNECGTSEAIALQRDVPFVDRRGIKNHHHSTTFPRRLDPASLHSEHS